MTENRSRPPGPVVPSLVYTDVAKAIDWLCQCFSFTERFRYGPEDAPAGAFLNVGEGGSVRLTVARTGQSPNWEDKDQLRPPNPSEVTHSIVVHVPDVDAHFEQARRNGVRYLSEPTTYRFGERQYTAVDLEGHRWAFSQSVTDVAVSDWGGREADMS